MRTDNTRIFFSSEFLDESLNLSRSKWAGETDHRFDSLNYTLGPSGIGAIVDGQLTNSPTL
jgi:hypothetical protein